MRKRNLAISAIVAIMAILTFAGCQPKVQVIPGITPSPSGPGTNTGNSSVLDNNEKETVQNALNAVFAEIGGTVTESKSGEWTGNGVEGEYDLKVNNNDWTLDIFGNYVTRSSRNATGEYDFEIHMTSEAAVSTNSDATILVKFGDEALQVVPANEVIDNTVTPPAPEVAEWDITFRPALHVEDGFNDYDNGEFVTVEFSNNKAVFSADFNQLTAYTSTDSEQAKYGDQKWFPVLVGTGISDLIGVKYNTSTDLGATAVTEAQTLFTAVDGNPVEDDEFILWLRADDIIKNEKTITLSRDGATNVVITISMTNTNDWDITLRPALHINNDGFDDHENGKYVDVVYSNGKAEFTADFSKMTPYTSTNEIQAEYGDQRWFPVLVGTGVENLEGVKYNDNTELGNEAVSEAQTLFTTVDGNKIEEDDEFILWLRADDLAVNEKTIKLSRNGAKDIEITLSLSDTSSTKDWAITVNVGDHNSEDIIDNIEAVTAEYENGKISVTLNGEMTKSLSTDPNHDDAEYKWFALLIGTGVDNLDGVTFNDQKLTQQDASEASTNFTHKDLSSVENDEFVLWLAAEDYQENNTRTIKLSKDGKSTMSIIIEVTDNSTTAE